MTSIGSKDSAPRKLSPQAELALKPARWAVNLARFVLWCIIGLVILVVVVVLIYGGTYLVANYGVKSGEGASQVRHGVIAAEEPTKGFFSYLRGAPGIKNVYQALANPEQPVVSFESDVQSNQNNPDLGVKIISFSDPRRINRPGEDIELTGSIKAASLDDDVKLQVFCYLENYNHDLPVLADVLGGRAEGNEVTLFKGAPTSINFNCLYRGGVPETDMKRPKETRFAKVVVAYQFTTKASERVYFLPRETLDSLDRNNVNPFTQYKVDDPYLKSDRTITSVSTAGPINLGLAVNFPQPLTVNPRSAYQFFVQLSNNPGFSGSLQKIESLELQVPDVPELSISLQGEQGFSFGRGSRCDFEYAGPGEQGFKVYTLSPERLAEVNRECDLKSLKELAISESQCVDLFKTNPLFGCKFVVNKVPQSGLQFDTFRSTASYVYKVERRAAVDVYKLPELGSSAVA